MSKLITPIFKTIITTFAGGSDKTKYKKFASQIQKVAFSHSKIVMFKVYSQEPRVNQKPETRNKKRVESRVKRP